MQYLKKAETDMAQNKNTCLEQGRTKRIQFIYLFYFQYQCNICVH